MGPYAPDSPARCGSPSRDPNRKGSSFTSPVRPELFKHPEGGHLGSYLNINYTKVWGLLWDVHLLAHAELCILARCVKCVKCVKMHEAPSHPDILAGLKGAVVRLAQELRQAG